jgi:hypothetical protein
MLQSLSSSQTSELPDLIGYRELGGKAFHGTRSVKAIEIAALRKNELSIFWRCNRPSMAKD